MTWDATSNSWVAQANDGVDDADASVTNELSNLSISGNTLTLTNPATSGNSVTIPTELPTSGTDNDVFWDATSNSWVAQANDSMKPIQITNLSNVLTKVIIKITNLTDPTEASRGTKAYVDNASV